MANFFKILAIIDLQIMAKKKKTYGPGAPPFFYLDSHTFSEIFMRIKNKKTKRSHPMSIQTLVRICFQLQFTTFQLASTPKLFY